MTTVDKAVNLTYGRQERFHTKKTLFNLGLEDGMMPAKKGNFLEAILNEGIQKTRNDIPGA